MKFKDLRVGMIVEQVKSDSDSNTLAKVGVVTGVGYMYDTEILLNASNRRDTDLTKTEVLPIVQFISESTPRKVRIEQLEIYCG